MMHFVSSQPAVMEEQIKVDKKFEANFSESWDLKTCNNHLVNFIDRARILAEAYDVKESLPSTL